MTKAQRQAYWRSTLTSLLWLSYGFVITLLVPFFFEALPGVAPLNLIAHLVVVFMAFGLLGIVVAIMLIFYRQYARSLNRPN